MMAEAVRFARQGKQVSVIVTDLKIVDRLVAMAFREHREDMTYSPATIRLDVGKQGGKIWFKTTHDPFFSWTLMRICGMGKDSVTLIDHHAFEQNSSLLLEFHRWDPDQEPESSPDGSPPKIIEGPFSGPGEDSSPSGADNDSAS